MKQSNIEIKFLNCESLFLLFNVYDDFSSLLYELRTIQTTKIII